MNRKNESPRASRWPSLIPGALLALALQSPAGVQAKCQLKAIDLPVKIVGSRAIATVQINGTQVPLMVDSGAFFSILTDAAAAQLNLSVHALPSNFHVQGVVGRVQTRRTTVDHLKLGNGDLPDMDFLVGGNETEADTMGILGRNILGAFDTEYDLAHGMIRLVKPNDECANTNMAYWAGKTPVSVVKLLLKRQESQRSITDLVRDDDETAPEIQADLLLNGHRTTAVFDSGASTTVSLEAARAAGVKDDDLKSAGEMIGAGRGKTDAWTASFDTVEIGGERVRNNRLRVADFAMKDSDMLLGSDFFLSHHIYVAQKQARIYFTYNGGPVFALNVDAPAAASGTTQAEAFADKMTADELARRGAASLTRRDLAGALSDLDRACALEPGNAGYFATRAKVHLARQERDAALADVDEALRLDPAQTEARLGRAYLRKGRAERDLALQDLDTLDKSLPPQSTLRESAAMLYDELGVPAQALNQWNQWIDSHPHDMGLENAYDGRCHARFELGIELDKALDDCDQAVGANSKNASYATDRGWVYLRLGKLQKALADFDHALAIAPDRPWALYGRGQAHLGLGHAALGQADLAAARQVQPKIDALVQRTGMPVAAQ